MIPKQATRLIVQSRPKCTAKRGCQGRAFILHYILPDNRAVRICSKCLARVKRTGSVKGNGTVYGGSVSRGSRSQAMLEGFRRLARGLLEPWRSSSLSAGSTAVWSGAKGQMLPSRQIATNLLWGFARRGWVSIGRWNAAGVRSVKLTKAGREALRE